MGRQKPSLIHEPMYGGQNSLISNERSRKQDPPRQRGGQVSNTVANPDRFSPSLDEVVNIAHCIQWL
jgi:hypothetical protein